MSAIAPRWVCDTCQKPIDTGKRTPVSRGGHVVFLYDEWRAYEKAMSEFKAEHPTGWYTADMESPSAVQFHVLHYRCDRLGGNPYSIDIPRIATWAQVAHWSAHLHGKAWFADTDWNGLMGRAGVYEVVA